MAMRFAVYTGIPDKACGQAVRGNVNMQAISSSRGQKFVHKPEDNGHALLKLSVRLGLGYVVYQTKVQPGVRVPP